MKAFWWQLFQEWAPESGCTHLLDAARLDSSTFRCCIYLFSPLILTVLEPPLGSSPFQWEVETVNIFRNIFVKVCFIHEFTFLTHLNLTDIPWFPNLIPQHFSNVTRCRRLNFMHQALQCMEAKQNGQVPAEWWPRNVSRHSTTILREKKQRKFLKLKDAVNIDKWEVHLFGEWRDHVNERWRNGVKLHMRCFGKM